MRVIHKPELLRHFDAKTVLQEIESSFKLFAQGKAQVAPVAHLAFSEANGECHVKSAYLAGEPYFVVKLATGFYGNEALGLPSSNGFMAVVSASTGESVAILNDEGALTDLRTALAGVLATRLCARKDASTLGVIGSGIQAQLQATMICELLGYKRVVLWARSRDKASSCAERIKAALPSIDIDVLESAQRVCAQADTIVTTTASRQAIIQSDWVVPGTHITAVGADSPGKQELDADLFAKANTVVADSIEQCSEHGELANALLAGTLKPEAIKSLGEALLSRALKRDPKEISIADLTGVAIQDVAIATSIVSKILVAEERGKD